MANKDPRPFKQRFAMWLIKSPAGLRFSARGRTKAAALHLDGVVNETVSIPRRNGDGAFRARIYKPKGATGPLPIVLYFHGGGYATGWPERHHAIFARLMETRPCIIVAPAFRLSIEAPYPAGHDDCYDSLLWVRDHAHEIGGQADGIVLAGNSSGGGLALSTALRARDTGEAQVTFQMPLYPMVDDRAKNWTDLPGHLTTWKKEHGVLAWHLLLRSVRGQKQYSIPAYATPARAEDLSNLPPTLSYVGGHDILRDEVQTFVERMADAGNDVTFQVFDSVFHAMEDSAPEAEKSREIHDWVNREFARMIDSHCPAAQG
ncbi:MAG: alpha/beta hydrolase [Pelagimonas sp.]|jgi:acetyl esterase/lipase|nr:alpha/beta hydrolase [Pelagimonas sp.]